MGKVIGFRRIYSIDEHGNELELSFDDGHKMTELAFIDDTVPEACDWIRIERDRYGTMWLKQEDQWIRLTLGQARLLHAALAGVVA